LKLAFVDLETTGIFPSKHGIHSIAIKLVDDDLTDGKCEWFVENVRPFPTDDFDATALKISGKTFEDLAAYPSAKEVYAKLNTFLEANINKFNKTDKAFFLAYNARFDADFLRKYFEKCGDKYFGSWFWTPPIDIMSLASVPLMDKRHTMENFKLGTVADTLGVTVDSGNLHNAQYDVSLAEAIYRKVVEGYGKAS